MTRRLLRYPIDIRPALLVTGLFVLQLAAYFYLSNLWLLILASLLLIPARLSVMGYNHNHVHVPTFMSPLLNRLLEIMMFFETGTTPYSGMLNHIIGHHARYFDPGSDTLNWRRADGSTMGGHEFALACALRHYPSCFDFARGRRALYAKFAIYSAGCFLGLAALLFYKPWAAVIVYVVPMALMLYMLKLAAHAHHSGLPIGDDYLASRTNTSRFYNWLTWNAGYHAAHHFKPALHWSELPAYHAELAARIPAELQGENWGPQFAASRQKAA